MNNIIITLISKVGFFACLFIALAALSDDLTDQSHNGWKKLLRFIVMSVFLILSGFFYNMTH